MLDRLPAIKPGVSAGELDEAARALDVVVSIAPDHRTAVQWFLSGHAEERAIFREANRRVSA